MVLPMTTKARGGKRPGSGRKRGVLNKTTISLKNMAGEYTSEAVKVMVAVMRDPETPPAVKIQAADKLLDRGHGRPAIHVEAEIDIRAIPWEELRLITEKSLAIAEEKHQSFIEGRAERLGLNIEYASDTIDLDGQ